MRPTVLFYNPISTSPGKQRLPLSLLSVAAEHVETVMPGYTHVQRAQPITLGHHMLAYGEMLLRDRARFRDCRSRTNVLPLGSGALAGSQALQADALDFAADAATYGISLAVIGRSAAVRSSAAMVKGASLAALALFILGYAIWRAASGAPPEGFVITGLGALGFFANALAALLLVFGFAVVLSLLGLERRLPGLAGREP